MKSISQIILLGLLIAGAHFILTISLGVYFGLGMSRKGTWFITNVFMQPGAFIVDIFKYKNIMLDDRFVFLFNFIFYWCLISIIFYLKRRMHNIV
jgi:hypothetical protein